MPRTSDIVAPSRPSRTACLGIVFHARKMNPSFTQAALVLSLSFRGSTQILTDADVASVIPELKTHSGKRSLEEVLPANWDAASRGGRPLEGWRHYLGQSVARRRDTLQDQFHLPGQRLLGAQQHARLHPKSCLGRGRRGGQVIPGGAGRLEDPGQSLAVSAGDPGPVLRVRVHRGPNSSPEMISAP